MGNNFLPTISLNSSQILMIISGILFTWIVSFFLHIVAFKLINYKLQTLDYKFNIKLISVISPDFLFSDIYKGKLPKVRKKDVIIKINKINLTYSIIIAILIFIHNKQFNYFEITYLVYHLISRISEITYAFYKDITEAKPKTTTLKQNERLKLAINSYFEIIMLYSCIYYIVYTEMYSYIDSLIISISSATFTLGFGLNDYINKSNNYLMNIIILTQVISTINIITLSIASYLGSNNKE